MGYVERHLLPGEQVTHRAHLHKIIYLLPGLFASLALVGGVVMFATEHPIIGALALLAGAVPLLWTTVEYRSSEFAVTDKRVIAKVGWIQRRTLETMLGKVEGVGVDQSFTARLLGFGTITVTGTGGTREQFANIANPLEFRRQVQAQISAGENARQALLTGLPPADAAPREERDCPYCAERILARAKVCKHCGRDVEPLVTR
jgi:uncharacterized membrane protein YdbT with pleckstrin-like domain